MSSACTKFLSHPIEDEKNSLIDHLIKVGQTTRQLYLQASFSSPDIAFYSGLLHDIGKLNPFYQQIFHEPKNNRKTVQKNVSEKFIQQHSIFSALAAYGLLKKCCTPDDIDKIMALVYCHHTHIRKSLGRLPKKEKFKASREQIMHTLPEFSLQVSNTQEFSGLNWEACIKKFPKLTELDVSLTSKKSPDDYLEMSYAFSCLLQADRGSFYDWQIPKFDLKINTESRKRPSSILGTIRTNFQTQVMENFDDSEGISIINAPTGIGKSKAFLDIINRYSGKKNIQRVFYFSPLLALTEDFEAKISKDISEQDDVLIFNHLFSGTLSEKNQETESRGSSSYVFENDTFNKKFIITTTQRLLMTIYSDSVRDKIKFASFRNSVLIIDEVQTIPKQILSNLKVIFRKMNQHMGTKIILVSATIPHEISDIVPIRLSDDLQREYLSLTKKNISVSDDLNYENIPIRKTLVMANTRKKAYGIYEKIHDAHSNEKIIYISSGIRKKDRKKIIQSLSEMLNYLLVSTQVVEAGVDISFSDVFRECAPLDNIIQVMGRLNREGDNPDSKITVFQTDGNHIPYSKLEFDQTQKVIQNITNSVHVYDILEQYYSDISKQNKRNIADTETLEHYISRMDFEKVWKIVRKFVFEEDERDTVFVPDKEEWDSVKDSLLYDTSKNGFKKFGDLIASLPKSVEKIGMEYFDTDLMEKKILFPKKEYLETVYDKNTGLDKWIML